MLTHHVEVPNILGLWPQNRTLNSCWDPRPEVSNTSVDDTNCMTQYILHAILATIIVPILVYDVMQDFYHQQLDSLTEAGRAHPLRGELR